MSKHITSDPEQIKMHLAELRQSADSADRVRDGYTISQFEILTMDMAERHAVTCRLGACRMCDYLTLVLSLLVAREIVRSPSLEATGKRFGLA